MLNVQMVIKKVLDSGTFTALQKSLLYIPPRAVSRNGLVVSVFYFRDGGRNENMWGQAVIKGLLIKFGLSEKHTKFETIFLMVLTN